MKLMSKLDLKKQKIFQHNYT